MEFDQCLQSLREELAACCGVQNLDMIPWSWVANAACQILTAHSSGLARTVLLTELEAQWHQAESQEILQTETYRTVEPFLRRATTKPPPSTVFNLRINQSAEIPNTNIRLWKVAGAPDPLNIGDARKGGAGPKRLKTADMQLDMFVHQRYYPMIESREFSDFFRHQRTFFVTGLMLADRAGGSHGEPIHTFLPTTSLAFELHIKDNPNLAPALRRHTDEQLLRDVFGVQYSDAKFVQCSKPILNVDQLWCKVDNISSVEHKYRNKIIVQCLTMECVLEHKPRSVTLSIEFYENDVSVARLFRQDDYIGLLCPLIKPANEAGESVTVEYGPDTIAFIMRGIRERVDSMRSQMTIQANEFGFLDYRRYAHRLQICQLQPDMIHLTMMARVQGVSENVPTKDGDGRLIDRYSVCIEDGSGICYATLWGELGRQASRLVPGQCILLHNFESDKSKAGVNVNGSKEAGSSLFEITTMTSILLSSELRSCSYLRSIPLAANRYVKACIDSIAPVGECLHDARDRIDATVLIHTRCRKELLLNGTSSSRSGRSKRLEGPVDTQLFDCTLCRVEGVPVREILAAFSLLVQLDDGTDCVEAQVMPAAASVMLGLSPDQFLELPSRQEQLRALSRPLGREFVLSLTSFGDPPSLERGVRVDAACSADDIGVITR